MLALSKAQYFTLCAAMWIGGALCGWALRGMLT
jgi:hypothetical protein